jgi:hypothetical protein
MSLCNTRSLGVVALVVLAGCASSAGGGVAADDVGIDAAGDAASEAAPADGADASDTADVSDATDASDVADTGAPLTTRLSADFQGWLASHGYGSDDFVRAGSGGSFGGRASAGETIAKIPIVFVHGNSDAAIGRDASQFTGWDAARRALLASGWSDASMYGATWGPADASRANDQTHERGYLTRLRRFFAAVQQYTGAPKIAVVAHSMGTTLARKAIEGGTGTDAAGGYDLGAALTPIVDTFVGIAGGNRGLTYCYVTPDPPTCSKIYGFWPGANATEGPSTLLASMNATPHDEGGARLLALLGRRRGARAARHRMGGEHLQHPGRGRGRARRRAQACGAEGSDRRDAREADHDARALIAPARALASRRAALRYEHGRALDPGSIVGPFDQWSGRPVG